MRALEFPVHAHDCAVWTSDGQVAFRQENHGNSGSGSPTDGVSLVDGWGSSVADTAAEHPGYESPITVASIDFSRFLRELPAAGEIVCKMNIEGSEFAVLRKLLSDGTIDRISKLYVEFHPDMVPGESGRSVSRLVRRITRRGVAVDTTEIFDIPYSVV